MAEIKTCNRFNAPSHRPAASANMHTSMTAMLRGETEEVDGIKPADYSVLVKDLDFKYPGSKETTLDKVTLKLPKGRRCLLVGGNGAGKTTLLRILGGKHMHNDDQVFIMGKNAFKDTRLNFERQYMDPNWGMRTVAFAGTGVAYSADIPVCNMMKHLQDEYPERCKKLYKLLKVDPDWRMHKVSDGQRRRVQMLLGLLRPFKVLLLDEVTAVLDLVCRQDLLQYLKEECETRGCTIVYATHIFDGLDEWATDLVYLRTHPKGTVGYNGPLKDVPLFKKYLGEGEPSPLMKMIETWLRAEEAAIDAERVAAGLAPRQEEESGVNAMVEKSSLTTSTFAGGGYTSGRLLATNTKEGGGFDRGRFYNYW